MTDLELLVLHGLVVKKSSDSGAVAALLGADAQEVGRSLERHVAEGRAAEGRGMFMVTPTGRTWLDECYPQAFTDLRADARASTAYERFERVNRDLLALFTDWQTMRVGGESVPNDHSDPEYDRAIINRLGDAHERALKALEHLVALQPRLKRYVERLESAYDKVLAGETDFVSGIRVDSYHTIWFELHEDLLRMLGRTREE